MKKIIILLSLAFFQTFAFSQNVGIGTSSPATTLDVNGSITTRTLAGSGTKVIGVDNTGKLIIVASPTGPTGPTGVTGTNGSTGVTGVTGPTGVTGANGTNGVTGPTGITGSNGTNGTNGVTGPTGITGTNGSNGTNGTNGSNGVAGVTGPTGVTGAVGSAGTNGTNGSNGSAGVTGPTGITGAVGSAGTNGTNGTAGTTGATGSTGVTGVTGSNGTNGTNGSNGSAGATGATGSTGLLSAGSTGAIPYYNGTSWIVNGTNVYDNGGSIGIGNVSPNSSAVLDLTNTTKGFLIPVMTYANEQAISLPTPGLQVFNTTSNCIDIYINSKWQSVYCPCPALVAGTITPSGAQSPCASSTGNAYSIPGIVGAYSYTWSVTAGATVASTNENNASITAPASGTYTVSCVIANACNTSVTATSGLATVLPIPGTPVITGATTAATSTSGNVYSASSTNATSYSWAVTGAGNSITSSGSPVSVTWGSSAGTYAVNVTATDACGTASATQNVVVSSCSNTCVLDHSSNTGTIQSTQAGEVIVVDAVAYNSSTSPGTATLTINGSTSNVYVLTGEYGDFNSSTIGHYTFFWTSLGAATYTYSISWSGSPTYKASSAISVINSCRSLSAAANVTTYNPASTTTSGSIPNEKVTLSESGTTLVAGTFYGSAAYDYGSSATCGTESWSSSPSGVNTSGITNTCDGFGDNESISGFTLGSGGTSTGSMTAGNTNSSGFFQMFTFFIW